MFYSHFYDIMRQFKNTSENIKRNQWIVQGVGSTTTKWNLYNDTKTMAYTIETRWPKWAPWKPIEIFDDLNVTLKRIEKLREWNSGEFRVGKQTEPEQIKYPEEHKIQTADMEELI